MWLPLGVLVLVFSGSLFGYLAFIAPDPYSIDTRAGTRDESGKAAPLEPSGDPTPAILALAAERFRPTPHDGQASYEPPPSSQSPVPAATPRSPKAPIAPPLTRKQPTVVAAPREPHAAAAAAPTAIGATDAVVRESKPASRSDTSEPRASLQLATARVPEPLQQEQALAAAALKEPPVIVPLQKEATPAAPPDQKEAPAAGRSVRSEPHAPAAMGRGEQTRAPSSWLQRMRAELDVCGKPGLWRNDLCRETVRWNYCHPSRWDSARECAVERFASSAVPN